MLGTLTIVLLLVVGPALLLGGVALGRDDVLGADIAAAGLLAIAAALILLGLKALRRALRRR